MKKLARITEITPQKKNLPAGRQGPKRFNIFLDGQFAFGADEDLVVEYRLVSEKIIDPVLLQKLLFEAEVGKLMERMYRLFEIRSRSEKEVRDYLKKLSFQRKVKGEEEISEPATKLLINKLIQKQLLSDENFAKAWVEARRRSKKKGKLALKQELFQKGIAKEIIEEVLSYSSEGESSNVNEEQLAEQALEKKWRIWKNLSFLIKKKKVYEFLIRRGFEYEVVKNVIEKLMKKE